MSKVRCNNCMNEVYENEIVYDGETDTEYCPFCGESGCLMDLEDDSDNTYNFLRIVNEIDKAISEGLLQSDPNNKNNILIFREAGKINPEGWYSENILEVAGELANNDENYKNFKEALENARKDENNNE